MSILGIDHVALAVKDLDRALKTYQELLEAQPRLETIPKQGVSVASFETGESRIELIEPLNENNTVAQFLSENGEGLHHVALRTDNIESELERVEECGITLLDEEPREGAEDYKISFLHPKDLHGTLVEFAMPNL